MNDKEPLTKDDFMTFLNRLENTARGVKNQLQIAATGETLKPRVMLQPHIADILRGEKAGLHAVEIYRRLQFMGIPISSYNVVYMALLRNPDTYSKQPDGRYVLIKHKK